MRTSIDIIKVIFIIILKINESCSEKIELSHLGVNHGKCIDDNLISEILGVNININKVKNQREDCGCVASIDIGTYNTCKRNFSYCYANFSEKSMKDNIKKHNVKSQILVGSLENGNRIYDRKIESFKLSV